MKVHITFTAFSSAILLSLLLTCSGYAGIININGSFEEPVLNKSWHIYDESSVPGWQTTASDNGIELWNGTAMSGNLAGSDNDFSYDGNQHAELNANMVAALFQDVSGVDANEILGFEFAHRGRKGEDTIRFTITDFGLDNIFGSTDDTELFSKDYSTGNLAWDFYTSDGFAPILTLGNTLRFSYDSIASASKDVTYGNLLDAVKYTTSPVPEPTTMLLFGIGLVGLGGARLRRKKC